MSAAGRNQRIGKWGEEQAELYLQQREYQLVCRNYRTRYGEIDLIFQKSGVLIFVEVKARTGSSFGMPEDAVTPAKQAHLIAAIQTYLQATGQTEDTWQIDVIAVIGKPDGMVMEIEHFENAVHG